MSVSSPAHRRKTNPVVVALHTRPQPPPELTGASFIPKEETLPAYALEEWVQKTILSPDGPLHNPEHAHLIDVKIGFLWTCVENVRRGRRIVGMAEQTTARSGKWQQARADQQLVYWFGEVPTFLITIDAIHASGCSDAAFCALVEHELYHCAQERDDFGGPKFNQQTGEPIFCLRGHDVEEFVGVVERYGIEAAGEAATDMVIAAAKAPLVSSVRVSQACGNCLRTG